jgi:predicted  nucleic acid-binding Zn-ribbon protein
VKYQKQLYSVVTSNREYDAITAEIESAEQRIDAMETEILELSEREDALGGEIEELKAQIEVENTKLEASEKDLAARLAETEQIEKELASKRDKLIEQVSVPVFSRYERIRKAKDGLAVVPVKHSSCQGCFTTIPPQRGLEIRQKDHMILCETCGRILIWENGD